MSATLHIIKASTAFVVPQYPLDLISTCVWDYTSFKAVAYLGYGRHGSRTVARKSSIGGLYVFSGELKRLCRGFERKNSYCISYFNLGELGALFGGAKPTKAPPPWRRDCMARAMGANLTWAQSCLAKIKICDLQFLQPLFCAPYNH